MHETDRTDGTIHVACGQIVSTPGDIEANLSQIAELAAGAAEAGAQVILFGEAALTGYLLTPEIVGRAPRLDGAEAQRLVRIAQQHRIVLAVGAIEAEPGGPRVSHWVVYPDGRVLAQWKNVLTEDERNAGIVPGDPERRLFEIDGVTAAIGICADSAIEDVHAKTAARGCQLWLAPSAGGGSRDLAQSPESLRDEEGLSRYLESMEKVCFVGNAIGHAARLRMAWVSTNLAGDDGVGKYHPGHSCIIDARGHVMALLPGEYVPEYLEPRMIHAPVCVR